jgi:hypothetical protein
LQTAPRRAVEAQRVENNLVPAILVTFFCTPLCGIPAIIYACQVNTKVAQGDVGGAITAARASRTWCWVGFGLSLGLMALWAGCMVLAAAAGH